MTDDMIDLMPCPFCGSKSIEKYIPSIYEPGNDAMVYCGSPLCEAGVRATDIEIAREKWNRRATVSDGELLAWVNTWLDSARFDTDLTEEEQDACWIVLSAVARLQRGGGANERWD